jgi:hypothetical protein
MHMLLAHSHSHSFKRDSCGTLRLSVTDALPVFPLSTLGTPCRGLPFVDGKFPSRFAIERTGSLTILSSLFLIPYGLLVPRVGKAWLWNSARGWVCLCQAHVWLVPRSVPWKRTSSRQILFTIFNRVNRENDSFLFFVKWFFFYKQFDKTTRLFLQLYTRSVERVDTRSSAL